MADDRTYIRVHDGIEDHPKVAALSDKAFRLLVTTWAWCSKHRTDGRIPPAVWKQRGTPKARDELVKSGLVLVSLDVIQMHDYLEHQRSADEIAAKVETKRKAGALGNHNRWHLGKRYDPTCPICIANGSQVPSHEGSQNGSQRDRKTSPETETETETEIGETSRGEGHLSHASDSRPPERCPRHLLEAHPGPCGACADARRTLETWTRQQTARVRSCQLCDADGRRWDPAGRHRGTTGPCDHQPARARAEAS